MNIITHHLHCVLVSWQTARYVVFLWLMALLDKLMNTSYNNIGIRHLFWLCQTFPRDSVCGSRKDHVQWVFCLVGISALSFLQQVDTVGLVKGMVCKYPQRFDFERSSPHCSNSW